VAKPTRETIRKRVATRRRNAAIRERNRKARVHSSPRPELAAIMRLESDGASSTAAVQRRVRALAHDRNIPARDVHKLMYKRPTTHFVMVFCEKYKVSYDWLRGSQGPAPNDGEPCAGASAVERRIMEKYGRLLPDQQRVLIEEVNRLLAEQAIEGPEAS
jgi:hypothetical protein